MKRTLWKSPVPPGVGRTVKVLRPSRSEEHVIDAILDRASVGFGVRVYRWPCGTVAIAPRDGEADVVLDAKCQEHLFGTYAKGSTYRDVKRDFACVEVAA